jgi:NAD(P)-dependent dehydrogenase (short-subunit alcohol dehydrogenase family)
VQAAELKRYGITANAIAPAARTRMTEEVFATMMAKPASGFDAMDPENVSPLVAWLGSAESRTSPARSSRVSGGKTHVGRRLAHRPEVDKGARLRPPTSARPSASSSPRDARAEGLRDLTRA